MGNFNYWTSKILSDFRDESESTSTAPTRPRFRWSKFPRGRRNYFRYERTEEKGEERNGVDRWTRNFKRSPIEKREGIRSSFFLIPIWAASISFRLPLYPTSSEVRQRGLGRDCVRLIAEPIRKLIRLPGTEQIHVMSTMPLLLS